MKASIVVLISGSGSNLQAIIDACANHSINAEIVAVIANRPHCYGLQRAKNAGIRGITIDHTQFATRQDFDRELASQISKLAPDLVVLAGFMRILSAEFVAQFEGKLLNIHPSLLPKYPGLDTHQRAIDAGDSMAGATVHFVTAELDGGPPIVQASVAIEAGDNAEKLAAKVLRLEHQIYPLAVKWYVEDRISLSNGKAVLDNTPVPPTGVPFKENECKEL